MPAPAWATSPPSCHPDAAARSGHVLGGPYGAGSLPREVAVQVVLDADGSITERPDVPGPTAAPRRRASERRVGRAGVDEAARPGCLHSAGRTPARCCRITGAQAAGRPQRRARPAIAIDVAAELGLIDATVDGCVPWPPFPRGGTARTARWRGTARAWWALVISPTRQTTEDDEVSPPVPMASSHGSHAGRC